MTMPAPGVRVLLAAVLMGLTLVPGASVAKDEPSYLFTERSDQDLLALVQALDLAPAPRADAAEAPAVCLTREKIMILGEEQYRIDENAIYRVFDAERSHGILTRHFLYSAAEKIERTGAWVLRGNMVTRCAKTQVTILKGDDDRPTELIIAIPDVRAGDVVGWSVRHGQDRVHPGTSITLFEAVPVRVATLRVKTDGRVAYRVLGRNLVPGSWNVGVLEHLNGSDSHILATVRDIEPVVDEPYAPPPMSSAPVVMVTWRGWLDASIPRWFFMTSWNEAAVWLETVLDAMQARDGRLEKKAAELTAGIAGTHARLDALCTFVRDEIVRVDDYEMDSVDRAASEVLSSRTATRMEAGALLCALARAAGLSVRPVLARSLDLGPVDDGNPGLLQFSDFLVESLDQPHLFYAPACVECAGGTLPSDLYGAAALTIEPDLAARNREVIAKVLATSSRDRAYLDDAYEREVARKQWCTMFRLPGDPAAVQGTLTETVRWPASGDTASVELTATGRVPWLDQRIATLDPRQTLVDYCARRHPAAKVLAGTKKAESAGGIMIQGTIQADYPGPAGDTWLLSADQVFGRPFLPDWQGPARGPFHFATSRYEKLVWRAAVPPGWRLSAWPAAQTITHPRFTVTIRAGMADGEVVVIREYQLRRGTTPPQELDLLDEAIAKVRRIEETPLVLVQDH
jgi:hypothetical protein